jgi:hypothetical protein
MIKRKGTIVSFGNASGLVEPVDLLKLSEKNVKLLRPMWVASCFPRCFILQFRDLLVLTTTS